MMPSMQCIPLSSGSSPITPPSSATSRTSGYFPVRAEGLENLVGMFQIVNPDPCHFGSLHAFHDSAVLVEPPINPLAVRVLL